jgi:hypothetical protein
MQGNPTAASKEASRQQAGLHHGLGGEGGLIGLAVVLPKCVED